MYKSYSYNDMPMQVKKRNPEKKEVERKKEEVNEIVCKDEEKEMKVKRNSCSFLDGIEQDDLILLAVMFVLLSDDCDDKLLLLAIAYIFMN